MFCLCVFRSVYWRAWRSSRNGDRCTRVVTTRGTARPEPPATGSLAAARHTRVALECRLCQILPKRSCFGWPVGALQLPLSAARFRKCDVPPVLRLNGPACGS